MCIVEFRFHLLVLVWEKRHLPSMTLGCQVHSGTQTPPSQIGKALDPDGKDRGEIATHQGPLVAGNDLEDVRVM